MTAGIPPAAPWTSLAVVGQGNIGSQLAPLLAGLPGLSRAIFVDDDRYDHSNAGHQRVAAGDIGKYKADVQARLLRSLAPQIAVETCRCRIEAAPLGLLRGSLLASCVDSRSARQSINRIAFRLGMPWVDAAIDRAGSVRARAYLPESGGCLECEWGDGDYEQLEQRVPCDGAGAAAPATAAAMELGAIAAGLQCSLLRRLFSGQPVPELADQQWFFDLPSGRGWIGRYAGRNPQCRFDHQQWLVAPLARGVRDITLAEIFALPGSGTGDATLAIEGHRFVRRLRCPRCRSVRRAGGRVSGRLKPAVCHQCGGPMMPAAMDALDCLSREHISRAWLDRPLAAFGLMDGDIVTLQAGHQAQHYALGAPTTEAH